MLEKDKLIAIDVKGLNMTPKGAVSIKSVGMATSTLEPLSKQSAFVVQQPEMFVPQEPTPKVSEDPSALESISFSVPTEKIEAPVLPEVPSMAEPTISNDVPQMQGIVQEPQLLTPDNSLFEAPKLEPSQGTYMQTSAPTIQKDVPQIPVEEVSLPNAPQAAPEPTSKPNIEDINQIIDKLEKDIIKEIEEAMQKIRATYSKSDSEVTIHANAMGTPVLPNVNTTAPILPDTNPQLNDAMNQINNINVQPDSMMVDDTQIQPGKFLQF